MRRNLLHLAHVAGVDVRAHPSWLLAVVLVGWTFWAQFALLGDRAPGVAGVMAMIATVTFFVAVLIHELAHAMVARRAGLPVTGVTLFVFGGATETRGDFSRPATELAVAVAGPIASVAVAGLCWPIAVWWPGSPIGEVAGLLAWLSLALGIFNLLPAAPMDGGHVLRAAWWRASGDADVAGRVAARVGQALGIVFVTVGVAGALLLSGTVLLGVWLVVLGWFVIRAASAEHDRFVRRLALRGRTAGEVSPGLPRGLAVSSPLTGLAERLATRGSSAVPATDGGVVVGVLLFEDLTGDLPPEATNVDDVARRLADVPIVHPAAPAVVLLDALHDHPAALVSMPTRPFGLITRGQLRTIVSRLGRLDNGRRRGRPPPVDGSGSTGVSAARQPSRGRP